MGATAKARRTYIPTEYRFTGVSMNLPTPENSTISSKQPAHLLATHAENGAIEEDVLPPAELRMEAGADLEQTVPRGREFRRVPLSGP